MTGRAMGFCNGYDTPGFTKGFGQGAARGRGMGRRGLGFGRGGGFGFGRRVRTWSDVPADTTPWMGVGMSRKDEEKMLRAQAENLRDSLKTIENRLKEMEDE
jgi:hypothetical protein